MSSFHSGQSLRAIQWHVGTPVPRCSLVHTGRQACGKEAARLAGHAVESENVGATGNLETEAEEEKRAGGGGRGGLAGTESGGGESHPPCPWTRDRLFIVLWSS